MPKLRVTDEMVRSTLTWARNDEEIVQFERIANVGRKWRVTLHRPLAIGSGLWPTGCSRRPPRTRSRTLDAVGASRGHPRRVFGS